MDQKITIEEIDKKTMSFVIASASDSESFESKDLRLFFAHGRIEFVVRYFKRRKLKRASIPLRHLEDAIKFYNSL